jgi:hypothetical protein
MQALFQQNKKLKINCKKTTTRCCMLRHAKNTPTRSFVSNLYISQHSLPENGSQTNLKHRALVFITANMKNSK